MRELMCITALVLIICMLSTKVLYRFGVPRGFTLIEEDDILVLTGSDIKKYIDTYN